MSGPHSAPTPMPATPAHWWVDALWLVALAVWSAGWCLTAEPHIGVTYDEPFYLDAGMDAWHGWERSDGRPRGWDHTNTARSGVMPLPPEAITIPLYVHEQRTGQKLTHPDDKLSRLRWARAVTLGWLWLLVFSAWRLGRAASGPWAGRIAAGLLACDPSFLGHATLATTDIPTVATLTAFARAVYAGRAGGPWQRILLPGLWYGLAVLCKLSALLYGGIILVVLEICYRFASGGMSLPPDAGLAGWAWRATGATLRSMLAAAAVIVIGVAFALAYCGMPDGQRRPFQEFVDSLPATEPLVPKYRELAARYKEMPHAVTAFAFQWWQSSDGRPSFLNGTYYPKGVWYFFPVILAMKVPLPVIFLAAASLARPRGILNPLLLAAVMLLGVLLKANLQIGFRLGFPVLALSYIGIAIAIGRGYGPRARGWVCRRCSRWRLSRSGSGRTACATSTS